MNKLKAKEFRFSHKDEDFCETYYYVGKHYKRQLKAEVSPEGYKLFTYFKTSWFDEETNLLEEGAKISFETRVKQLQDECVKDAIEKLNKWGYKAYKYLTRVRDPLEDLIGGYEWFEEEKMELPEIDW